MGRGGRDAVRRPARPGCSPSASGGTSRSTTSTTSSSGLLADESLPTSLPALCRSIAASVEGHRAAVFFGFDGDRFAGVAGSWEGAAELDVAAGPWVRLLGDERELGDLARTGRRPERSPVAWQRSGTPLWLVAVEGRSIPPAVLAVWPGVQVRRCSGTAPRC